MTKGIVLTPALEGKGEKTLYPYLTARLRANNALAARQLLAGWLAYANARVAVMARQTLESQRLISLETERQQLGLARTLEAIERQVSRTRLGYALLLAQAAGVTQPVFTRGETFRDDPDFPITLGEKGLRRKLDIFNNDTDLSHLSVELQEREDMVRRMEAASVDAPGITAFHLLLRPKLPARRDGLGMVVFVLLGALFGLLVSACVVLLREACQRQIPESRGLLPVADTFPGCRRYRSENDVPHTD